MAILDRELCDLCRGLYEYPGDLPVTWDYKEASDATDYAFAVKSINGVTVVVSRGSADPLDWIHDFEAFPVTPGDAPQFGPVHFGFSIGAKATAQKVLAKAPYKKLIVVTGHSLGAAHTDGLTGYLKQAGFPPLARVVFGEPKPGYQQFADYIKDVPARAYRNAAGVIGDPVTAVPFRLTELPWVHPCAQIDIIGRPHDPDAWGIFAPHRIQYYAGAMASTTTGTNA